MNSQKHSNPFPFSNGHLNQEVFELIRDSFHKEHGYNLVYADIDGNLIYGLPDCDEFPCIESCRMARQQAIEMALTYGFPFPTRCPVTYLFWALPVNINNQVIGAFITVGEKRLKGFEEIENIESRLKSAQDELVALADKYNVINRAFLQQRQRVIDQKQRPFPSPPNTPRVPSLTELWTRDVKKLMDAIFESNLRKVMEVLDKIIAELGGTDVADLPETKGFTLELFAAIVQYAIKENGYRQPCFRFHCETAEKIVKCKTVENLCVCLREQIELFLETQKLKIRSREKAVFISKVYSYIETNLNKSISREQVAQAVGLSPSRLSHILKEEVNESYSDILTRFRLEQARRLLLTTAEPLSSVATDCGYFDQSHFSKVFQKHFGSSPMEYRRSNGN